MTVIAWDGKSIAADRRSERGEITGTVLKLFSGRDGYTLATCGTLTKGLILMEWFNKGADREKWPEFQSTNDCNNVIVARKGELLIYCQDSIPLTVLDKFSAWGSGGEFAIGAMEMGATAEEAVLATNKHCASCGHGVDVIDLYAADFEDGIPF